MKLQPATIACVVGLAVTGPAFSWGSTGHQLVGATAYLQIKGTNAQSHVDALLKKGHAPTLAAAAEWPDCVRSVKKRNKPTPHLEWAPDEYTPAICVHFSDPTEDPQGQAMMIDYANRNWSDCNKPADEGRACHELYHFADVPVADGHYDRSLPGTADYDIVATINACIKILRGEQVSAPFDKIKDYEALFVLAHLVGDMHQPLHVGAIYLAGSTEKTPGSDAEGKPWATQGGNKIFVGTTKLHGMWDTIDGKIPALQTKISAQTIGDGMLGGTPSDWASESVKLAGEALHPTGVAYASRPDGTWSMTFAGDYKKDYVEPHQISQAALGGARLAAVLKQIWP